MWRTLGLTLLTILLWGCKKNEAAPAKVAPPAVKADAGAVAKTTLDPMRPFVVEGFKTPESVLWDDQADVYLVSNINGKPLDVDDNGFISRLTSLPDGSQKVETWIDGKSADVTLNAPKGMALLGDLLYVADIDRVRTFDRKTGAPKGEILLAGAKFVNDLCAGADVVYASDSGLDATLTPTPDQGIWEIRAGKGTQIAKGEELGVPNGLALQGADLWVVTFASGEIYRLTKDGKREGVEKLPKGGLDGLVITADGRFFVSSWEAQVVYHGKPGAWATAVANVESPADIGFDAKRSLLLVPQFLRDKVELHQVPAGAPAIP